MNWHWVEPDFVKTHILIRLLWIVGVHNSRVAIQARRAKDWSYRSYNWPQEHWPQKAPWGQFIFQIGPKLAFIHFDVNFSNFCQEGPSATCRVSCKPMTPAKFGSTKNNDWRIAYFALNNLWPCTMAKFVTMHLTGSKGIRCKVSGPLVNVLITPANKELTNLVFSFRTNFWKSDYLMFR